MLVDTEGPNTVSGAVPRWVALGHAGEVAESGYKQLFFMVLTTAHL